MTSTVCWGRRGVRGSQGRVMGEREVINVTNKTLLDKDCINMNSTVKANNNIKNKIDLEQQLVRKQLAEVNDGNNNDSADSGVPSQHKTETGGEKISGKSYRTYSMNIKKLKGEVSTQLVTVENQLEMVSKAVTMLHHLPYKQQLTMKQIKNKEVVARLKRQKKVASQVCCVPSKTLPSPVTEEYRTKVRGVCVLSLL